MGWKQFVAVWIISVLAIWILGAFAASMFYSVTQSEMEAGERLAANLTDVNMILIYVGIGTILSPCCYAFQKASE